MNISFRIARKFGENFTSAVWRIVKNRQIKNRQIKFSPNKILTHYVIHNTHARIQLQERSCCSHSMYMFPLSGKDIKLVNKAVKRPLCGDLKPVTRSPRGKYNAYFPNTKQEMAQIGKYAADNGATKATTHFSKLLDSEMGESNVSIVKLSDKKTFSSVVRCAPTMPNLIGDYVIAFAVRNRQIKILPIFNFSRFWRFHHLILTKLSGHTVYHHTRISLQKPG